MSGTPSTDIHANNEAGNFVGSVYRGTKTKAYTDIGGTVQFLKLPNTHDSYAYGINNANEVTGYYYDQSQALRNFVQDSAGIVTLIKIPNIFPIPRDLNDSEMVVGTGYTGRPPSSGIVFRFSHSSMTTYTYPGGGNTDFYGIDNNGVICGDHQDNGGLGHFHGLLVQAVPKSAPN